MSDDYDQLLASTIDYLQALKARGARYVSVDRETLGLLDKAAAPKSLVHTGPRVAGSAMAAPLQRKEAGPLVAASTVQSRAAVSAPVSELIPTEPVSSAHGAIIDAKETVAPVLTREEKIAAMQSLRERALACQKCPHLVRSRKNVVFGVGDIFSPLMFVGEAPGADEDTQGEPFVGKAGQLLTKIIQTMGFDRQSVYIANILKCRPDTPGQSSGNRKPTADEMKTCLPYLLAQIDLIQPKVIVALGATAVEGLLGLTTGITRLRGRFQGFRGVPVMPTYHPSYLLRNQSLSVKREVWEDMLQVMEKLQRPISEKQRGYFLKSAAAG